MWGWVFCALHTCKFKVSFYNECDDHILIYMMSQIDYFFQCLLALLCAIDVLLFVSVLLDLGCFLCSTDTCKFKVSFYNEYGDHILIYIMFCICYPYECHMDLCNEPCSVWWLMWQKL